MLGGGLVKVYLLRVMLPTIQTFLKYPTKLVWQGLVASRSAIVKNK
jgi:hypothetical protein